MNSEISRLITVNEPNTNIMDDNKKWVATDTQFNNEIVVPSYREFCKKNDLKFHFWDEMPEEDRNYDLYMKEFELHKEAMVIFNNLKVPYVFFNDRICSFYFTDWSFAYDKKEWKVDDFFHLVDETSAKVSGLESQLKHLSKVFAN